jgi:hypothetical protein
VVTGVKKSRGGETIALRLQGIKKVKKSKAVPLHAMEA